MSLIQRNPLRMNRTDRLVAMVMFMQGRRLVKADELAEHFEISVRTVYRDMSALSEGGVPISGEAGVGYSLVKGYHLPPVMLTADEASALFWEARWLNISRMRRSGHRWLRTWINFARCCRLIDRTM